MIWVRYLLFEFVCATEIRFARSGRSTVSIPVERTLQNYASEIWSDKISSQEREREKERKREYLRKILAAIDVSLTQGDARFPTAVEIASWSPKLGTCLTTPRYVLAFSTVSTCRKFREASRCYPQIYIPTCHLLLMPE